VPFSKSLCAGIEEEKALQKCIERMAAQNLIASRALGSPYDYELISIRIPLFTSFIGSIQSET
jgi:hypothetical protein